MDTNQEMTARLEAKLEANQVKTEANLKEMIANLDAHHERTRASVNAW
jgi:hypothetical protein